MSGFNRIYCVGGEGGFQGADGINPILFQIWVGDGSRQWLEPHYVDTTIRPIAQVKRIVQAKPNDPEALLDACIAFYPDHFRKCPSIHEAALVLADTILLDFDSDSTNVPLVWAELRQEARVYFKELCVMQADLIPVLPS